MINKKIDICIGTDRLRVLRIRLSLMLVDDTTGNVLSEHFHSASLAPGGDPEILKVALNNHLGKIDSGIPGGPWPTIPDAEWNEVLAHVDASHTPEKIAEYVAITSLQQPLV